MNKDISELDMSKLDKKAFKFFFSIACIMMMCACILYVGDKDIEEKSNRPTAVYSVSDPDHVVVFYPDGTTEYCYQCKRQDLPESFRIEYRY